ncbi:MAG TPA: hypothetical protein PLK68_00270, partial [Thomasclavelia ramosa]|nr:hypothetical protein [Thomasclavelia ramosa]
MNYWRRAIMDDKKEFKFTKPNKEKLNKEANAAKVVKNGGKIFGLAAIFGAGIKKYGPQLLDAIRNLK